MISILRFIKGNNYIKSVAEIVLCKSTDDALYLYQEIYQRVFLFLSSFFSTFGDEKQISEKNEKVFLFLSSFFFSTLGDS